MSETYKNERLAFAGSKGGKARASSLTPEDRQRIASMGAAARWGSPTPERVVEKMVTEIYRTGRKKSLYRRDATLWFDDVGCLEERRWEKYLIGTYGPGAMEDDVLADVAAR